MPPSLVADIPEASGNVRETRMSVHPHNFRPRPAEGLRYPNVVFMAHERVTRSPHQTAFYRTEGDGWAPVTWAEWWSDAQRAARGLGTRLRLESGDSVLLMCGPRYEWIVWELAIAMLGAVCVPVDAGAPREELGAALRHAACVAAVVEHPEHLRVLAETFQEGGHRVRAVAYLDPYADLAPARGGGRIGIDDVPTMEPWVGLADMVVAAGAAEEGANSDEHGDDAWSTVGLSDTFSIVYTSGTTGSPRGVSLSHKNMVYESWAIKNSFAVDHRDLHVAFLPLHHIFARHMVWAAVASGAVTGFCRTPAQLPRALEVLRPTFLGGVPWTFEKIRSSVEQDVGRRGTMARRQFAWAMRLARRVRAKEREGARVSRWLRSRYQLAEKTTLGRLREGLGGRVRFAISGAAPIRVDTLEFFHAAGVLILEGYGLTETTGATHVNRPNRFRFGSVGLPLPGCEASLAEDGEILVRGHHVMAGYHDAPEHTEAVLDDNGWLHTGDLGVLDAGFLSVVGRKKELIITDGGKNVAPAPIERTLRELPEIAEAVVVGDRRPCLIALITLDEEVLQGRAQAAKLGCSTYHDLVCHPEVRRGVAAAVDTANEGRTRAEQLRGFALLPAPLSRAEGELTATLKVRRREVIERYAALVDATYETAARRRDGEVADAEE